MRFASLGSGSAGNGTVVQIRDHAILIDCGFSVPVLSRRMRELEIDLGNLRAVLISHEHRDHVAGVGSLARQTGVAVYATPGTWREARPNIGTVPRGHEFSCHAPFALGDFWIEPFPVPHDAREPCQFVVGDGVARIGVLTDAGHVTGEMRNRLNGCDGLLLEFNHDRRMLMQGNYPPALIDRIDSDYGHLNNDQSARLLAEVAGTGLRKLIAGHLSENNNSVMTVQSAIDATGWDPANALIACQQRSTGWVDLS